MLYCIVFVSYLCFLHLVILLILKSNAHLGKGTAMNHHVFYVVNHKSWAQRMHYDPSSTQNVFHKRQRNIKKVTIENQGQYQGQVLSACMLPDGKVDFNPDRSSLAFLQCVYSTASLLAFLQCVFSNMLMCVVRGKVYFHPNWSLAHLPSLDFTSSPSPANNNLAKNYRKLCG